MDYLNEKDNALLLKALAGELSRQEANEIIVDLLTEKARICRAAHEACPY